VKIMTSELSSHTLCWRGYDHISIKFDWRRPTVEGWDGYSSKITEEFEICGSRSGAAAHASLLGCYALCSLWIYTDVSEELQSFKRRQIFINPQMN